MHIRITQSRRGTIYEVLCDVCGEMIGLDEDCDALFARNSVVRGETKIAHKTCARIPGRFTNHWTQMMRPRWIVQTMADQDRSPVITDFLRQLKQDQKERLNRP